MATDKVSEKPEEKKETPESVAQKAGEKLAACAYDPNVKMEKSSITAYDRLQRSQMEMEAILNNNRLNNGPKIYEGAFGQKAGAKTTNRLDGIGSNDTSTKAFNSLKERAEAISKKEPTFFGGINFENVKPTGDNKSYQSNPDKAVELDQKTETAKGITDAVKEAQLVNTEMDKLVNDFEGIKQQGDLVKLGDKLVKYNNKGEVIYSREGSIVTVTEGGKNYVYDEATKVREVWGPNGLEVRVKPDGTSEVPDGKGGYIRFDREGKKIWTVNEKGNISGKVVQTADGRAVYKTNNTDYQRIYTDIDTSNPAKLKEVMERLYKEGKRGAIEFNNATILLTEFKINEGKDNEKTIPEYLLLTNDGMLIKRLGENSLVKTADGQISLIDKDGRQHLRGTSSFQELSQQINEKFSHWFSGNYIEDSISRLESNKVTSIDQQTTLSGDRDRNGKFSETRIETADSTIRTRGDKTTITNNQNGMVLDIEQGKPGFNITTADGRKIERDNQGLKIGDLRVNGTNVTDERTGVRMSERGIESSQVRYDSSTGRASFSDGSALEADGTYVRMSNTLVSDSSKKAAQQAAEGRAMGLARAAEAQALSLIAKAASGRVSASDIDALSASLGSIEGSIKALSDQGDMISMVKLMMTKGTVSESLGKAQQMAGKQSLVA